jgi:integrase
LLHKEAYYRPRTVRYYAVQLGQLVDWSTKNDVPFEHFGKRHMDRYAVYRRESGVSETTLHHDGICAKNFQQWCVENDLLNRSLLAEYKVPRAPKPFVYTPTSEEVAALLVALKDYWDPEKNPAVRFEPSVNRGFHRDRNYALFFGLVETGCRIGEMLSLKLGDYDPAARRVTFRETKGKESRTIPVSPEWCAALEVWLKTRRRVTRELDNDEGWIFISVFGGRLDEGRMNHTMNKARKYAGLRHFTPHGFRHYTITKLSSVGLPATQIMVGHKDPKTTMGYIDVTEQRMREVHERAGIARRVLVSKRPAERKRLI